MSKIVESDVLLFILVKRLFKNRIRKKHTLQYFFIFSLVMKPMTISKFLDFHCSHYQFLCFFCYSESHTLTVKKLAFRPVFGEAGKDTKDNDKILQLASAGSDHLVRVYTLFLEKLISGVNSWTVPKTLWYWWEL